MSSPSAVVPTVIDSLSTMSRRPAPRGARGQVAAMQNVKEVLENRVQVMGENVDAMALGDERALEL